MTKLTAMAEDVDLINRLTAALADRDIEGAVALYAPDAELVRYEGVARGTDEIRAFLVGFLTTYEQFSLVSLDNVVRTDDTIVWASSNDTGAGILQTTNVVVLDAEGRIVRHVPLMRGYWGRT